jgi:hypothetical protein
MTILQKVGIRWKFLTAEKFDGRKLPFFYRHFHHFLQSSSLQKGQNCAISVKKETKIAKNFRLRRAHAICDREAASLLRDRRSHAILCYIG